MSGFEWRRWQGGRRRELDGAGGGGFDVAGGEAVELKVLDVAVEFGLAVDFAGWAGGFDLAVVEDDDVVAAADGGEAVREEDEGAALGEAVDGVVDEVFDVVVEGGVGFFDDDDGGVVEEGACQGDAVLVFEGEGEAEGSDDGVVALG